MGVAVTVSTDKLEAPRLPAQRRRTTFGRRWRGCTGSLAAGLAAFALFVLVVKLVSALLGAPGPKPASLIAHPLAAILALAAQRVADRRDGWLAGVAGAVVVIDVVLLLVFFWWWP